MPQLFQVLKCYQCSVFQVHQTKKSNKWECKLCGEKQSIKRHYGLGTGKECRLHVQKLNGIRGEVDESNKIAKLNESSDEEILVKHDTKVLDKKQANLESKWSDFVDKTEDIKITDPNETTDGTMFLGNAEVVLEIPSKRRKLTKHKIARSGLVSNSNQTNLDNFDNMQRLPSPPPIQFYETQSSNDYDNIVETNIPKNSDDRSMNSKTMVATQSKPQKTNTFIPHKIDKNSKWAQYEDETDEEKNDDDDLSQLICNDNIDAVTDDQRDIDALKPESDENNFDKPSNISKNIFALCDENDLDDVLEF